MTDLPAPLTTEHDEIDNYDSFMLNVDRLMASELMALSTGEEFKAAVALWCRAWKQRPAGSLPDDDRVLAAFSGVGSRWVKVKEMALRGFVKCNDGRLYHAVLCEDVHRAAEQKRKRNERTKAATEARKQQRNIERDDNVTTTLRPPDAQRDVLQTPNVTRSHSRAGQGIEERKSSEAKASGADAPISDQDRLWRDAPPWLRARASITDAQARSIIGRWLKANPAPAVLAAISRAQAEQAVDPISFVTACLKPGKRPAGDGGFIPLAPGGG